MTNLVIGGIRTCLGVSMIQRSCGFFQFLSTEFAARLMLTRVRVEPRSWDQSRRKNDAFIIEVVAKLLLRFHIFVLAAPTN